MVHKGSVQYKGIGIKRNWNIKELPRTRITACQLFIPEEYKF